MIVSLPSTVGCRGWPELFCTTPWILQQNTEKGSSLKELVIYQVCVKLPSDSPTSLYPRRASEQINNAEVWVLASKTCTLQSMEVGFSVATPTPNTPAEQKAPDTNH